MSLPAVTSPKAQWLTPKLMALPCAQEDCDDLEECAYIQIQMPAIVEYWKSNLWNKMPTLIDYFV